MITGSTICGRAEVGVMVLLSAVPEMSKLIRSVSVGLLLELAAKMASLKVHWVALQPPVPGSAAEFTVKELGAAWAR